METINYITKEGDRIDILSHKFYGSQAGINVIAAANPHVPLDAIYPLNTELDIPIIERTRIINQNLPPWKRNMQ